MTNDKVKQDKHMLDTIETMLGYLDRLRKNKDIIEQYYFSRNYDDLKIQTTHLFEGVLWIEYAMVEMYIPVQIDQKDRMFEGVGEAIEAADWLTVIDFVSYSLPRYIDLVEQALSHKYLAIKESL